MTESKQTWRKHMKAQPGARVLHNGSICIPPSVIALNQAARARTQWYAPRQGEQPGRHTQGLFFEKNLCILLEERVKVRSDRVLIGSVRNPVHSPAHFGLFFCSPTSLIARTSILEQFREILHMQKEVYDECAYSTFLS